VHLQKHEIFKRNTRSGATALILQTQNRCGNSRYHRIKARRGSQRAVVAIAHTLLRTIYMVLKTRQPYQEPVRPPLTEAQRTRKAQRFYPLSS
jgi:hypothetical protein